MYHLTDADIYQVCKTTEQFLKANKTEYLESLRLKMMMEEVLLNYQTHFGEKKEFSLKTGKMFGRIRVVVSLPDSVRTPLLEEYITPVSGTVMGILI